MEKENLFIFYFFFVLYMGIKVEGSHTKLFVFGDSYADTGNHRKPLVESWKEPYRITFSGKDTGRYSDRRVMTDFFDSYADTGNHRKPVVVSWKEPYGITFPGKPTGRYSDGRVMTDFLASIIGIWSPIPYQWRKINSTLLRYGMNFAFGGTGVFKTLFIGPNMTTQIGFFKQQIDYGVYSKDDINSSIGLVSCVGNDYTAYQAAINSSSQDIVNFTASVINQLTLNLQRINDIGVRKIAVTGLQPLGCLPSSTTNSSHQHCTQSYNDVAIYHNYLLEEAVKELNKNNTGSTFIILDLYSAFNSTLQSQENQGSWKFENPLKPCCEGISDEFSCGSVDDSSEKKYTLCENRKSAFFWDGDHPTQQGWAAISAYLKPSLLNLYKND